MRRTREKEEGNPQKEKIGVVMNLSEKLLPVDVGALSQEDGAAIRGAAGIPEGEPIAGLRVSLSGLMAVEAGNITGFKKLQVLSAAPGFDVQTGVFVLFNGSFVEHLKEMYGVDFKEVYNNYQQTVLDNLQSRTPVV